MPELNAGTLEGRDTFKDYLLQVPNFFALFLVPISYLSISPALIEIGKDLNTATGNMSFVFSLKRFLLKKYNTEVTMVGSKEDAED
ncbi:MAG: hypothetical protein ACYC3T_14570 [Candidatus Humimicrobiaceae bacterium]